MPVTLVLGTSIGAIPIAGVNTPIINPFDGGSISLVDSMLGKGVFGMGTGVVFPESGDMSYEFTYPAFLVGAFSMQAQWLSIGSLVPWQFTVSDITTVNF